MKLPPKAVKEFQRLYKKNFNKKLTYQEAEADAMKLIRLVRLIQPRVVELKKINIEKQEA